jgi:hypothetical protein
VHPHINLRRGAATVLVAAGGLLLASVPAQATAPTRIVEQRHVDFVIASCGSFMLRLQSAVEREYVIYYDENGVPVRDVLIRRQEGTFSNSVTGKSADLSGVWRVTRTYTDGVLDGTAIQTGRTYTITVPGEGVIFQQSGRGIQKSGVTVFEAGPHDFDERNFAELCDYLAD